MNIFLSLQIISFVSSDDITIPTTFDFGGVLRRFQTTYIMDTNTTISAFASLSLGRNTDLFEVYNGPIDYFPDDYDLVRVQSWIPQEGTLNISTSLRIDPNAPDEYSPIGLIGGALNSRFVRAVGSYLVTPVTNETGLLIIRPADPNIYAYNREIYYATTRVQTFGQRRASIRAAIRVIPSEAFVMSDNGAGVTDVAVPGHKFTNCFLETQSRYMLVPRDTFQDFIVELDRLGMHHEIEGGSQFLILRNVNDAMIESLPIIQYIVLSDEDIQVSIQLLHPLDYAFEIETDPTSRRIILHAGYPSCDIPSIVTNKMMIHMDLPNGRVGFGEPLNDI